MVTPRFNEEAFVVLELLRMDYLSGDDLSLVGVQNAVNDGTAIDSRGLPLTFPGRTTKPKS